MTPFQMWTSWLNFDIRSKCQAKCLNIHTSEAANEDLLQRSVILGCVCEWGLRSNQVFVDASLLHPHHLTGILLLLLFLCRLLTAGATRLLATLLCLRLLLLGLFRPGRTCEEWLMTTSFSDRISLLLLQTSTEQFLTSYSSFSFSSSLFLLLKIETVKKKIIWHFSKMFIANKCKKKKLMRLNNKYLFQRNKFENGELFWVFILKSLLL